MKFKLFKRKVKQLPPPSKTPVKASSQTRKAIRFFNGKIPATDLLEEVKVDRRKKPVLKITKPTATEKFFDKMDELQIGKWLILGLATAFVVVVLYWGIKQ